MNVLSFSGCFPWHRGKTQVAPADEDGGLHVPVRLGDDGERTTPSFGKYEPFWVVHWIGEHIFGARMKPSFTAGTGYGGVSPIRVAIPTSLHKHAKSPT